MGSQKSFTLTIPSNLANLVKNFPGISLYANATQIGNKWDSSKSSTHSERRDSCGIVAIRSGQQMVGGFHGMLHMRGDSENHLMDQ